MSARPINLIGLTGYRGTGKDTVADVLITHGFQRYALASPLKSALMLMFDLSADAFDNRGIKEAVVEDIGCSPRYLAQTLGTEWGRRCIADDLWVRVMRRKIRPLLREARGVVVSDVRFDNEARAIHELGGVVVRVRRPSVDGPMHDAMYATRWRRRLWRLGLPVDTGVHPSEFGVSDGLVDASIVNDRSIEAVAPLAFDLLCDCEMGKDLWQPRFYAHPGAIVPLAPGEGLV